MKTSASLTIKYVDESTALVTKAFAKRANLYGTPEFNLWREYKAQFPKAKMHTKTIKRKPDAWIVDGDNGMREINIGAGTLSRPIENVVATLLHEMVHYYNDQNGVKDCSRGNTYHNRKFKELAEACDLLVEHHSTYGWSITSPSDALLEFCIDNDLREIRLNRNDAVLSRVPGIGTHAGTYTGNDDSNKKSSTRKYICPCCGMSVRATRTVNIACLDCNEPLIVAA